MNWHHFEHHPFHWSSFKTFLISVLAVFVLLWIIKPALVASYLTQVMKIPVSIGRVSVWPSETQIHSFKILSPRKFKNRQALYAKDAEIFYDWRKLIFGEKREIDKVTIDGLLLTIEFGKTGGNNWKALSDRMPKARREGKEVVLHELVINDITVEVRGVNGELQSQRHIDQLRFTNVSSKRGFPTSQLVRQLFQGAGVQGFIQDAFQEPAQLIRRFFNPFGWMLEENYLDDSP